MKLLRAEFQNFRLLRDLELEFSSDLDRKLTVIRAANESGKTTILHGLQWALYGDAALPGRGEDFRLHPIDWETRRRQARPDHGHGGIRADNASPDIRQGAGNPSALPSRPLRLRGRGQPCASLRLDREVVCVERQRLKSHRRAGGSYQRRAAAGAAGSPFSPMATGL